MANHHFGKLADVWKHLVLDEVLVGTRPARYAETHAGSAAYPIQRDAERGYGVLGFLECLGSSAALRATAFSRVAARFLDDEPSLYPGSALQAMTLLGDDCGYLLCEVDPTSAADLRAWAGRLELRACDVVERDGMTAVRQWLPEPDPTVVHIDPFDPFAHQSGGPSAVELAGEVAEAGHTLVYWYGFSSPDERAWALEDIAARTGAALWCGDLMVSAQDGPPRADGDLGRATTPGTGCGVVLANVPPALVARCEDLAHALVAAYDSRPLPSGEAGRLDLTLRRAGQSTPAT